MPCGGSTNDPTGLGGEFAVEGADAVMSVRQPAWRAVGAHSATGEPVRAHVQSCAGSPS